jgi:hypothetical protein
MQWYVVYRHGTNDSNQSPERGQPEKMPVVRVQADSPEEACRLAAAQVSLAPGQGLSAEPAEELDAREAEINRTARSLGTDAEEEETVM